MTQLIVRNLDDDLKAQLERRARRHGRSTEEEVREILRIAVAADGEAAKGLGSRLANRFAGLGMPDEFVELRGQQKTQSARLRP